MSSDVSCQSQDANKQHNQGSYASASMRSTQSSCEPMSLWSSRRSSEVSSVDRLSPSNSMRLSSLRSELPVIEDTKDISNIHESAASSCDTNGNAQPVEQNQNNPPDYFEATAAQNQTANFQNSSNFNSGTSQALKSTLNSLTPIPQSPQLFKNNDDCSSQNIDWNLNGIIDKTNQLGNSAQDTVNDLDNNKDLILPDDVVEYLNEVTKQESQANASCIQNQNSYSTQIKTDCCTMCKQDPHENPPFKNSCCKQSVLPPMKPFYANCGMSSHHMNFVPNNCVSHDITRFNCVDAQNDFNQNQNNFQPTMSSVCKNEFAPQSCNQMTSPHMVSGCSQQPWNTQNISTTVGFPNPMCPSHGVNSPTFYCNQQRYSNPPPYQVPNQYPINNHQMQMVDNRCHIGNCGSSPTFHVPPMFCSHNQIHHNLQTQQPVYQCSASLCPDTSNNIQVNLQQMNQGYNSYHQPGNQMHNHNIHNHYAQYHQCANCGAGQTFTPNCSAGQTFTPNCSAGQTFTPNSCYVNNSVQQQNTHQQVMLSGQNVQCLSQSSAQQPLATSTSTDIKSQQISNDLPLVHSEKTLAAAKTIYTPPKTESKELTSSCTNNLHSVAATGGNSTMTIQNCNYDNNISQTMDITGNVGPVSAQSILPTGNMVINDMNSILTSLMEETKYLKLLQ